MAAPRSSLLVLRLALARGLRRRRDVERRGDEAGRPGRSPTRRPPPRARSAAHVSGAHRPTRDSRSRSTSRSRADKGGEGTMSENGPGFDLVRVGDKVYIQGSDAFCSSSRGAAGRAAPARQVAQGLGDHAASSPRSPRSPSIGAALRRRQLDPRQARQRRRDDLQRAEGRRDPGHAPTAARSTSPRPASRTRSRSSAARRTSPARSRSATGTSTSSLDGAEAARSTSRKLGG